MTASTWVILLVVFVAGFVGGFALGYSIGFRRGCRSAASLLLGSRPRSVVREPGRPPNSRSGGRP